MNEKILTLAELLLVKKAIPDKAKEDASGINPKPLDNRTNTIKQVREMSKKKKIPDKYLSWIDVRKR